ncbi:SRPBCC family protein [Gelatiniphilus marinus]|uniref:SRPBCC domain-containing protein n=1 Tax=Gelatiniphilus marinus TaxID=1759464 RepID=A0ABW5JP95_9FLAO
MNDVIKKETMLNHNIDVVWSAITKAEEISSWFIPADFKAEPRYQYTFTSPSNKKGCATISGASKKSKPVRARLHIDSRR